MDSFEREQSRIASLFDDCESDGDSIPGDGSDFEVDNLQESDHDTDTDQDFYIDESDSESEIPLAKRLDIFSGKDGTNWSKQPPPKNNRTRAHNIVSTHLPAVKTAAKEARTSMDAWLCMIDESIIDNIVTCTNLYIHTIRHNFVRERDANFTNREEMNALFGLLYFAGAMRANHLNAKELWSTDGEGIELFPVVMGINRFHFLLRCLRFDNVNTREVRKSVDKLAPIREIFEMIVNNFKNGFSPSEYVTVDEKLEPFRGKCPFRQYIRSKPAKYGIKIFGLADARCFYTCNMEVYTGEQPCGPYRVSNAAADVVKRLVAPVTGTGRNIFLDNWFMSIPLMMDLKKEYNLTCTGTIRRNKRELPPEFIQQRGRKRYTSLFGFTSDMTIVSYVPKPGKAVLLGSTMHHDNEIDQETGPEQKPTIITDYNKNKGGIDVVDKLCGTYSVSRKSKRWPLTIFFGMLNVAAINAYVIYKNNVGFDVKVPRRVFLKELGKKLVKNHIAVRASLQSLPFHIKTCAKRLSGVPEEPRQREKRAAGRCEVCPRSKDRKTQSSCCKCNKLLCKEHAFICCEECCPDQV